MIAPPQGAGSIKDVLDVINAMKNVANGIAGLDSNALVNLANLPLIPKSKLEFSFAWEKVAEINANAVATVDITGLSGDTDKLYLLLVAVSNSSTAATNGLFIRYNADTTVGNYGWIKIQNITGTTSTAYQLLYSTSGVSGVNFGGIPANSVGFFVTYIHAEGIAHGTKTFVINTSIGFNNNNVGYNNGGGLWIKQAEITSITLFNKSALNLDWKVYLFKPKW